VQLELAELQFLYGNHLLNVEQTRFFERYQVLRHLLSDLGESLSEFKSLKAVPVIFIIGGYIAHIKHSGVAL
jgi:hypothetical protein